MIEQLNESVKKIESLELLPYIKVSISKKGGIASTDIQVTTEVFDKIIEEVDPILILAWPFNGGFHTVERSILIGTVRVFALYEE